MREIKFRAWDGTKLCQVRNIDFGANGSIHSVHIVVPYRTSDDDVDFDFHEIPVETSIIEQLTGLRDLNGKEIYDGDIIAIPAHYGGDHWFPSFDAVVTWEDDGWGIKSVYDKVTWWGDWRWEECEIIGNIHENPELLEGGNQ